MPKFMTKVFFINFLIYSITFLYSVVRHKVFLEATEITQSTYNHNALTASCYYTNQAKRNPVVEKWNGHTHDITVNLDPFFKKTVVCNIGNQTKTKRLGCQKGKRCIM